MNDLSLSPSRATATSHMDVSYSEAVRIFWRFFWPVLLSTTVVMMGSVIVGAVGGQGLFFSGEISIVQWCCFYILTMLFIGRIFGRPFRGFTLQLNGAGDVRGELTGSLRTRIAFFLTIRLFLVSLIAGFLMGMLNIVLAQFRIYLDRNAGTLILIFAVGPFVTKMLIGERLAGTRIEVDRA